MPFFRKCLLSFLALSALVSVPFAAAETHQELFRAAQAASGDYALYAIDLELAELKKGKAEIEAKSDLERLNAQSAYIAALADYRKSILAFHDETINAVYASASAELDAASARLKLANAEEDKKEAELLYASGASSEVELKEADIALQTAATDRKLADWNFQVAVETVASTLALAWKPELLPAVEAFAPAGSEELWLEKDTSLAKARLAEKISALKTAGLAANAPKYDRKIQETEHLKTLEAAASAEKDARKAYKSVLRTMENQWAMIQIRNEERDVKTVAYQDAVKQYESGLISQSDANLQQIALINAQKNLLQAQKSYLASIGSYLSAMGDDPQGL